MGIMCPAIYLFSGIIKCTSGPLGVYKWVVHPAAMVGYKFVASFVATGCIAHCGESACLRTPCREGMAPLRRKPGLSPSGESLGF